MTARFHLAVALLAATFLAVHLRYLPQSLEDIDSINLALGVESFDVAKHQPHAPGYPVFMAMAKLSTRAVAAIAPDWTRDRRAVVGLAIWGVIGGAAAAYVITSFWIAVGLPVLPAFLAALVVVTSPLFWITAARPLTDAIGLVLAVGVQTLWIAGWRQVREGATSVPREWWLGAVGAGLLIGIRSQSMWLTGPLAIWGAGELIWRGRYRQAAAVAGVTAIAVVAWAVPLMVLTGGVGRYLAVVGSQGAEDFGGAGMLAASPSLALFGRIIERTLFLPWRYPIVGQVVVLCAIVGAVRLARRAPAILGCLCLAFWPYVVFNTTFHETAALRYALPAVVPIAGLAVVALWSWGPRVAMGVTVTLAIVSVWIAQPDLIAYTAEPAPVFRALVDMQQAPKRENLAPRVHMHHQVWWGIRRATDWYRSQWDIGPQPFPGDREWLDIARHFRTGRPQPVWLLADLTRTDVAVFDWRARTLRGRYTRGSGLKLMVGRDRLEEAAWWEMRTPGWMLGRGWAVSPEIAGMTLVDQRQPHRQPAEAWLRRTPGPRRMMIGGRYLGGSRDALLVATIDGRDVGRWTIGPTPLWFVRWIELPAGALEGPGPYATLQVRVEAADGSPDRPELGLEQFDFAAPDAMMYAFEDGWQELEENPSTGLSWRWSSGKNTLAVYGGHAEMRLRIAGESPLRYFADTPTVTVSANGVEMGRLTPNSDFDRVMTIPAGTLPADRSEITIATSRTFVPAEQGNSPDRRQLGLRFYAVEIR